jgi:hypothetical protein
LIIIAPQKSAEKGPPTQLFNGQSTGNPKLTPGQGYSTHGTGKKGLQINVLYGDSHVSTLTLDEFKDLSSIKGRARWLPTTN